MFITCATIRPGAASASSGVFHQMYLLARRFKSSGQCAMPGLVIQKSGMLVSRGPAS